VARCSAAAAATAAHQALPEQRHESAVPGGAQKDGAAVTAVTDSAASGPCQSQQQQQQQHQQPLPAPVENSLADAKPVAMDACSGTIDGKPQEQDGRQQQAQALESAAEDTPDGMQSRPQHAPAEKSPDKEGPEQGPDSQVEELRPATRANLDSTMLTTDPIQELRPAAKADLDRSQLAVETIQEVTSEDGKESTPDLKAALAEEAACERAPTREELSDFIKANNIDERAAADLRECPSEVQRRVLARGELSSARNPSAALLARIRDARVVERGGGSSGSWLIGNGVGLPSSKNVEDFIEAAGVSREAAYALRSSSPTLKRAVLACGRLSGQRDPSVELLNRIQDIQTGGCSWNNTGLPSREEVDEFIKENEVDGRAAADLRDLPPALQRAVLVRGDLRSARNPSSALIARIRDAKMGMPGMPIPGASFDWMNPPPGGSDVPLSTAGPYSLPFMPTGYGPPGYAMYPGGWFPGAYPGYPGSFPRGYPGFPPAYAVPGGGYPAVAGGSQGSEHGGKKSSARKSSGRSCSGSGSESSSGSDSSSYSVSLCRSRSRGYRNRRSSCCTGRNQRHMRSHNQHRSRSRSRGRCGAGGNTRARRR